MSVVRELLNLTVEVVNENRIRIEFTEPEQSLEKTFTATIKTDRNKYTLSIET